MGFDASGKGYLKNEADRFYEACKLYNAGTIRKIIVSGGTVQQGVPKEADVIKSEMIAIGIQLQDVITETRSVSTYENAKFSKLVIDSLHIKPPYVLITSALHMPRAQRLFAKAGLMVTPFPCAYDVIKNEKLTANDWLLPDIKILDNWQRFIKEVTGVFIYHMFNKA